MTGKDDDKQATLQIAIVGIGQIGSAFAFQLVSTGGHAVTVVARPGSERLKQLHRDDGTIVNARNECARVKVLDALDAETPYDLVIVTLLAHQIDDVLPALQQSAAKSILFMFNNFTPQRLADAIGVERAHFGMPFVQAMLKDGRLQATLSSSQKTPIGTQRFVDVFNASGIPAAFEPKMMQWLRSHTPMCVAFESVSVAGSRRNGGAAWSEASTIALGVHACFELIETLDSTTVYPLSKRRLMYSTPTAIPTALLWTMSRITSFRELLATGERECVALVEVMTQAAKKAKRGDLAEKIAAMKPAAVQ